MLCCVLQHFTRSLCTMFAVLLVLHVNRSSLFLCVVFSRYALPYMTEPEKDPEFGPYFSQEWSDMLRATLHNFLSTILFSTPSPKVSIWLLTQHVLDCMGC